MSVNSVIKEIHWYMDVLQSIDVGLVVVDRNMTIEMWNRFMQDHTQIEGGDAIGESLFDVMDSLDVAWLRSKISSVFDSGTSAFTIWQQRPYVFPMATDLPLTGRTDYMYQNTKMVPLTSAKGDSNHVCIIVFDATAEAVNHLNLEKANQRFLDLSIIDKVTGLFNRAHWDELLNKEFAKFQRYQEVSTLMLLELDGIESLEEESGEEAVNEIARHVSSLLVQSLRENDVPGRYEQSQFIVLLANTDGESAEASAKRMQAVFAEHPVPFEEQTISYTVHIGIAEVDASYQTGAQWVEAVYRALKDAKNH